MANEQQQPSTGAQVAKTNAIKAELELSRPSFEQLNLGGLNFAKECEFAVQIFLNNSYLLSASPESRMNCLKNVALTGLSLNPVLKYAYMVPRKVNKVLTCCVDVSYVGLAKILTDTGSVVGISANIVYEREAHTLDVLPGMGGHGFHKPYVGLENPGKPVACYTVAVLPNGMKHVELIRPFEWEAIRERSESVKSYRAKVVKGEYAPIPTWISDESEMIRKTCIKKHYKYLPKSERAEAIAQAIDIDNQNHGIDFSAQNNNDMPQATPFAQTIELCNQDTFEKIMKLLEDPALGEMFSDGKLAVASTKANIKKRYEAEKLTSQKGSEWVAYLEVEINKAIAKATAEPAQEGTDEQQA